MSKAKTVKHPNRFSAARCSKLFELIRTQGNGRPCRGEVRWYGATDDGLRDVRGDIRLWGLKSEIELHKKLSAMEEHRNKTPTEISELVLAERLDLKKRQELFRKVHGTEYTKDK